MIRCAAVVVLLSIPAMTFAGNCAGIRTLADLAAQGFSEAPPDDLLFEVTSCDLSRGEGGARTYLCTWEFAYRAPGAVAVLDMLARTVPTCVRGAKELPADTSVNHPDSYDLRRFQYGNVVISASLKDKAELEKTLVFLRFDTE